MDSVNLKDTRYQLPQLTETLDLLDRTMNQFWEIGARINYFQADGKLEEMEMDSLVTNHSTPDLALRIIIEKKGFKMIKEIIPARLKRLFKPKNPGHRL